MFDPMFDLVATVLAWFYSIVPSYGFAIAMLTLCAMILATPLTLKSIRSMLEMSQHAGELKRIQNQHRGDRQAMQQATMEFYREHGINPMGSCLPVLVQAPVFLVLYQVVRGLTRRATEIGSQLGYTSLQHVESSNVAPGTIPRFSGTPINRGELAFDPDFVSRDTDLYRNLSENTEMLSLGFDLSRTPSQALSAGVIQFLPYLLMLVLILVTGLYQQHQIQKRQTSVVNKQTQMIMKLFPYFLPVISFSIPAAVSVYFIVSATYRIIQQAYITKSFYTGDDSLGAKAARQREADASKAKIAKGKDTSARGGTKTAPNTKSTTRSKGAPTPKRDNRSSSRGRAPQRRANAPQRRNRSNRSASSASSSRKGRTGKAPSRNRSRNRSGGGRTTPPGSRPNRGAQNRSRSKRKRR